MTRGVLSVVLVAAALPLYAQEQEVPLEYRVKAAYLYNFVRFVEWPPAARQGPVTICIVGSNPFGDVLSDTIRGETHEGRALTMRVVTSADSDCAVLFVPRGAGMPSLRATQGSPTLTVGESPSFIEDGGIVNFVREGANVRFEINEEAARRAGLRISSRLLRLARPPRT